MLAGSGKHLSHIDQLYMYMLVVSVMIPPLENVRTLKSCVLVLKIKHEMSHGLYMLFSSESF